MNDEEYLAHYGVLGMKWGVRRASNRLSNATNASERDSANASLKRHSEKAGRKFEKLSNKALKTQSRARAAMVKAEKSKYGLFSNPDKYEKRKYKAEKKQYKANKYVSKAANWYSNMESTFAKTDYKVTDAQRKLGESFINSLNMQSEIRYLNA